MCSLLKISLAIVSKLYLRFNKANHEQQAGVNQIPTFNY